MARVRAGSSKLRPSETNEMYLPPGRALKDQRKVWVKTALLVGFICIYGGVCTWTLNSAEHLPRFWLTNKNSMRNISSALIATGALLYGVLLVVMALKPELRPRLTCEGAFKPSRMAGHLWVCSVCAALISMPYMVWYFFERTERHTPLSL